MSVSLRVDGKVCDSLKEAAGACKVSSSWLSKLVRDAKMSGLVAFVHEGKKIEIVQNEQGMKIIKRFDKVAPKAKGFEEIASPLHPSPIEQKKRDAVQKVAEEVAQINVEMFGLRERQKRILQSLDDLKREVGLDIKKGGKR